MDSETTNICIPYLSQIVAQGCQDLFLREAIVKNTKMLNLNSIFGKIGIYHRETANNIV